MAKKKFRSSAYRRQLTGDNWFWFYHNTFRNLVYQMFEWKGLPETVNPFFLERTLHENGYAVLYDDPLFKEMALSGSIIYQNPYGEPTSFQASMINYTKKIDLYTYLSKSQEKTLGYLCKNQFEGYTSSEQAIFMFAGLMAENKQTMLVSQNALKIPFIFKGDERQVLTFKNMFEQIQSNEPYMVIDEDTFDSDVEFEVINVNAPYNLDKLNDNRIEIYNEFLTYFGIDNVNIAKKERVNVSEANSNNELIMHNRNKFLAPRKETALLLSDAWGREITVDVRENLHEVVKNTTDNKKIEGVNNG